MSETTQVDEPQSMLSTAGRRSLDTTAARALATTTKSAPQMAGVSSRMLLKVLPWVQVSGGTYRVNRRLSHALGDGRVTFTYAGPDVRVVPGALGELPLLRGFDDLELLAALAGKFVQREYQAGEVIIEAGEPADGVLLLARGRAERHGPRTSDNGSVLDVLADGDHFGTDALLESEGMWDCTIRAATSCIVLTLPQAEFERYVQQSEALAAHVEAVRANAHKPMNRAGEADIAIAAGHVGEPRLPGTFVDYDATPREYELSVAQTVLRVHTRVADLFNDPMNQTEQQLRLTVEALRERQEHEMINNPEFGLLHNADHRQRIHSRSRRPAPDEVDELLARRRATHFMLAHPRTISSFARECSARGLYPGNVDVLGSSVPAWRGVPILPCGKIPVSDDGTSSIIAMRVGDDQGVIGLHQTGIPDEYEPSLNVRFMGIDDQAVISYLVSVYYSVAVLVPDALGILEDCDVRR